ncbi:hypothetical protein MASR1M32_11240 [Rhodobacter sp.]
MSAIAPAALAPCPAARYGLDQLREEAREMTPSPADDPKTLVSTDWLASHLKDPDLRVLDASWFLPAIGPRCQGRV